jgi:hypothetical protein
MTVFMPFPLLFHHTQKAAFVANAHYTAPDIYYCRLHSVRPELKSRTKEHPAVMQTPSG